MKNEMVRQGDVLIMQADEIPKNAKPKKSNIIVEGEATGHCLSKDTQILTKSGWRTLSYFKNCMPEVLTMNLKTNELEFQKPTDFMEYDNISKMIMISNRNIDILVTDKHKIIYRYNKVEDKKGKWNIKSLDELMKRKTNIQIPLSGKLRTNGLPFDDEIFSLFGWIISEGGIRKDNHIRIYQSENSKYNKEIKETLNKLNILYKIRIKNDKGRISKIRNKNYETKGDTIIYEIFSDSGRWIKQLLNEGKNIPSYFINQINEKQFNKLLNSLIKGDGSFITENAYEYYSNNIKLIERLQILCLTNGYRTSIRENKKNENNYILSICKRDTLELHYKQDYFSEVSYEGKVWCITTPNGTIVCRRKGKPFIIGNSHRIVNGQILISKEKDSTFPYEEHETMWIKAFKNAQVVHEEHGLINLEIGLYMIVRQREWDDEKERLVLD